MLDAVERQNLSDLVAAKIREYIVAEGLKAGDRLPTEQALADRFGVSRLSVREATKALGFLGILEAAPRRGLTVGKVDMGRVTEYLGFHLALNDYSRNQLLETRIVIETGVLPYVMKRMAENASIYDRLHEINDKLHRARSLEKRIEADIAFHHTLLESSGLEPLVAFNDLLQIFFDRFRRSVASGDWKMGVEGHQRMIDSLKNGKLEAAVDELRRHLEYHKKRK
ncbi:MAG: FadR family transcriptional regulator [Candidatus Omnitrophica bacterium]|nr:FadR family transcriptional regulator [Candidatus Omnitrophota bacterium]